MRISDHRDGAPDSCTNFWPRPSQRKLLWISAGKHVSNHSCKRTRRFPGRHSGRGLFNFPGNSVIMGTTSRHIVGRRASSRNSTQCKKVAVEPCSVTGCHKGAFPAPQSTADRDSKVGGLHLCPQTLCSSVTDAITHTGAKSTDEAADESQFSTGTIPLATRCHKSRNKTRSTSIRCRLNDRRSSDQLKCQDNGHVGCCIG